MKNFSFLLLFFIISSCSNDNNMEDEFPIPITSISELNYPTGVGNSGDKTTSLIGYGYDATGFCDTISAKAKIVEFSEDQLTTSHPHYFGSNLLSSTSFSQLSQKIFYYPDASGQNNIALLSHIRSLMKLANKNDSFYTNAAIVHYEATVVNKLIRAYLFDSKIELSLSSGFKNDLVSLSPQELISKYGTHVLTCITFGTKFEVVYTCKTKEYTSDYDLEQFFLKRLNQFVGGTPGIIPLGEAKNNTFTDEQMIFNTIGSKNKMCGLIKITDNNPDGIHINYNSAFGDNLEYQFIKIAQEGMMSLDELIRDPVKKQEIKTYIENYVSARSCNNDLSTDN